MPDDSESSAIAAPIYLATTCDLRPASIAVVRGLRFSSLQETLDLVFSVAEPMLTVHFQSSKDDVGSSDHDAITASLRAKDPETLKGFACTFFLLVPRFPSCNTR
ncbi:unnamed protein product [Diplocarpon coronariae]